MRTLLLIGATLAGLHGAPAHRHHYWRMGTVDCVIATAVYRSGALRADPYITCAANPAGWQNIPQRVGNALGDINPADNVYAPPTTVLGTAPCDYEPVPCS